MEPEAVGPEELGPQRGGLEPPLSEASRCLAGAVVPGVGEGWGPEVAGAPSPASQALQLC